ncbi:MAG: hypothetical protein ACI80V_001621 [Rhodothermales bacterium]|jgi:hypothetical protein
MTTSNADSRTWAAIGVLILFVLTAAIGWIQGLAFSASASLAGQTVVPSLLSIALAWALSSAFRSNLKYRLMVGVCVFCGSYNLIGSALLSAPSGIEVPFLRNGASLLYAATMLVGGLVAGYLASLEPIKPRKFRIAPATALASGLAAFAAMATAGLMEGTPFSTAVEMGGQSILPAMVAGWVGVQVRRPIWHRRLLGRVLAFGIGLGVFGALMATLATPPAGIETLFFSGRGALEGGLVASVGGATYGVLKFLFDPDRDQPGNPAPA